MIQRSRDVAEDQFRSGLRMAGASLVLLSGVASVWAAPDRERALLRFAVLLAGLVLMAAIVWVGRNRSHWLGWGALGCAGLAALLGGAYVGYHPFSSESVAGPLTWLMLIGAGGIAWAAQQGLRQEAWIGSLLLVVAGIGLVATHEESAWVALAGGALAAGLVYWRFGKGQSHWARHWVDGMALAGIAGLLLLIVSLLSTPFVARLGSILTNNAMYSRPVLWHDTPALVQDYLLTGVGLGQTGEVFSTYVYLYHVAFIHQTYNLFLQIAVEQGLPGLIGFMVLLVTAGWQSYRVIARADSGWRRLYAGVLAALIALAVHGLVDAGPYVGRLMALLFIPLGFGMALPVASRDEAISPVRDKSWGFWLGAVAPVAVVVIVAGLAGGRAALYSNLGAVQQTRAELAVYHWPEWPIQDAVRYRHAVDLTDAIASYQKALSLDATNVTALRRLGQIALSEGDTAAARRHFEAAYTQDPEAFVTRLLLGELYALDGEFDHAAEVWAAGAMDPDKLELRHWWYTQLGADQAADRMTSAILQFMQITGRGTASPS